MDALSEISGTLLPPLILLIAVVGNPMARWRYGLAKYVIISMPVIYFFFILPRYTFYHASGFYSAIIGIFSIETLVYLYSYVPWGYPWLISILFANLLAIYSRKTGLQRAVQISVSIFLVVAFIAWPSMHEFFVTVMPELE